jgi:hypothetical protein
MKTWRVTYWDHQTGSLAQIRVYALNINGALQAANNNGLWQNITAIEQEMVCTDKTGGQS